MIDRDKVISNLQILRTWCAVTPSYDMGLSCREREKAVGWLENALKLLKAQEPRVLTVDEVRNNYMDYVYIETNTGWLECTIMDSGKSNRYFCVLVYGRDECFMGSWKEYGKTWRCWSARPTDERRKEVKWGD